MDRFTVIDTSLKNIDASKTDEMHEVLITTRREQTKQTNRTSHQLEQILRE